MTALRPAIHGGLRSPLRPPLSSKWGGDLGPTVIPDQSLSFGALTLQDAGDVRVEFTGSPPSDAVKTGGTSSADYNISSAGVVTASGDGSPSSGTVTGSYNGGVDTFTLTMTATVDWYSVANGPQITAATNAAIIQTGDLVIAIRPGDLTDLSTTFLKDKVVTGSLLYTSHEQSALSALDMDSRISSGLMPRFIDQELLVDNTDFVTWEYSEFYNPTTPINTPIINPRNGATDTIIQDNYIHGLFRDPNADYSGALSYVNPTGIAGNGATKSINTVIQRNRITDLRSGIGLSYEGDVRCLSNEFRRVYNDFITTNYNTSMTSVWIIGNDFQQPVGISTDADNPHSDMAQFQATVGMSWPSVRVEENSFRIGDARGSSTQLVFANISIPMLEPSIKANMLETRNSTHGITINRIDGGTVIGNTLADKGGDGAPAGLAPAITLGADESAGTITVYNNAVAGAITVSGTSDIQNNIINGKNGSIVTYADCYDGPDFDDLDDYASLLAAYSMRFFGPLDADSSGSPTIYDIGAVDTGYKVWPADPLVPNGIPLDATYETFPPDREVTLITPQIDAASDTSYSFTFAVGAEDADRRIAFDVLVGLTSNADDIGIITVNGVSATLELTDSGLFSRRQQRWSASIPTGATADIVVPVTGGGGTRCAVAPFRTVGYAAYSGNAAEEYRQLSANPLSGTIDVPENGALIATVSHTVAPIPPGSVDLVGVDKEYDQDVESGQYHAGGSREYVAAQTGITVSSTTTGGGSSNHQIIAIAYGPSAPVPLSDFDSDFDSDHA